MLTTACVIIDNETGVNYLFVNAAGRSAPTPSIS